MFYGNCLFNSTVPPMAQGPGRKSRLSMFALIQEGILTPGEKILTFDYMVRH